MIEQHTAVNLGNYFEEVIAHWNLPATHISAVVTDNASNITAAIASANVLVVLVLLYNCVYTRL